MPRYGERLSPGLVLGGASIDNTMIAGLGNRKLRRVFGAMSKSRHNGNNRPVLFHECPGYMLSNFSSHTVEMEILGEIVIFLTAEHAYQASKFTDWEIINKIILAKSAWQAKQIAHEHRKDYRQGWGVEMKLASMEAVLRAKVAQHEDVQEFLRKSGGRELIENSYNDDFWGWGENKRGAKHLGRLWMKIRAELFPV